MASRYNFGIKGYTRYSSRSQGVRFMTAWCNNDNDALALATALEQYLPNYSKVSVAKVIISPILETSLYCIKLYYNTILSYYNPNVKGESESF